MMALDWVELVTQVSTGTLISAICFFVIVRLEKTVKENTKAINELRIEIIKKIK